MHPKERHKMCKNCDGRIPVDTQLCPYCASEQSLFSSSGQSVSHHPRPLQEGLSSPYTPPSSKTQGLFSSGAEKPLYPSKDSLLEKRFTQAAPSSSGQANAAEAKTEESPSPFWPILTLSLAANLLVIGLLQLFFSDHGVLRLEWNSEYWYLYCLAALPPFFFGLKKA